MKTNKILFTFLAATVINMSSLGLASAEEYKMLFNKIEKPFVPAATPEEVVAPQVTGASCKEILLNGDSASGVKTLDSGIDVYCDMASDGGGWTMVVAQFEGTSISWSAGKGVNYDPSLSSGLSFALSNAEIPSHTETALGKSLDATFVDYFDLSYQTGNIGLTLVNGKKSGRSSYIYRNATARYDGGNAGEDYLCQGTCATSGGSAFYEAMTYDYAGGGGAGFKAWFFMPFGHTHSEYGTEVNGASMGSDWDLGTSSQTYAWTIWVR